MKSLSIWIILVFCLAIGSVAYADGMSSLGYEAFGGPGGGHGGGHGFGNGPHGPGGPGFGNGPHDPQGPGFGNGPHNPGGPGFGNGPHNPGGFGYGPNHNGGDWHHGGAPMGWQHRPGWNDGWQWDHDWRPSWYNDGYYFPDFVFTDDVPDYWYQCTAFNDDGSGDAQAYSDYASTQDEAAYNALEQCGGDNYQDAGCYIPDGYCQQYSY